MQGVGEGRKGEREASGRGEAGSSRAGLPLIPAARSSLGSGRRRRDCRTRPSTQGHRQVPTEPSLVADLRVPAVPFAIPPFCPLSRISRGRQAAPRESPPRPRSLRGRAGSVSHPEPASFSPKDAEGFCVYCFFFCCFMKARVSRSTSGPVVQCFLKSNDIFQTLSCSGRLCPFGIWGM